MKREPMPSPYKADAAKIPLEFFTEPPKYVKLHVFAENSKNHELGLSPCNTETESFLNIF